MESYIEYEELARQKNIQWRKKRMKKRRRKRIRRVLFFILVFAFLCVLGKCLAGYLEQDVDRNGDFKKFSSSLDKREGLTVADTSPKEDGVESKAGQEDKSANRRFSGPTEDILACPMPDTVEEAVNILSSKEDGNGKIATILKNTSQYPDKLIRNLAANSETIDYVLGFPDKGNQGSSSGIQVHVSKDEVPLFLQWDSRWGYAPYGESYIGISGCGPTCLAMAAAYVKQDTSMNPAVVAEYSEEHGYIDGNGDTLWALMTDGAQGLGLHSEIISLTEESMINELEQGHPIICTMGKGDFTINGHFIVVCGYENGTFFVNDPNSVKRSECGWTFDRISSQIRNLWAIADGSD